VVGSLADIKNSDTIRALSLFSKQVNADLFTKVATTSGINISDSADGVDPYGLFEEDEK